MTFRVQALVGQGKGIRYFFTHMTAHLHKGSRWRGQPSRNIQHVHGVVGSFLVAYIPWYLNKSRH